MSNYLPAEPGILSFVRIFGADLFGYSPEGADALSIRLAFLTDPHEGAQAKPPISGFKTQIGDLGLPLGFPL
jgi:hypothetical protein